MVSLIILCNNNDPYFIDGKVEAQRSKALFEVILLVIPELKFNSGFSDSSVIFFDVAEESLILGWQIDFISLANVSW